MRSFRAALRFLCPLAGFLALAAPARAQITPAAAAEGPALAGAKQTFTREEMEARVLPFVQVSGQVLESLIAHPPERASYLESAAGAADPLSFTLSSLLEKGLPAEVQGHFGGYYTLEGTKLDLALFVFDRSAGGWAPETSPAVSPSVSPAVPTLFAALYRGDVFSLEDFPSAIFPQLESLPGENFGNLSKAGSAGTVGSGAPKALPDNLFQGTEWPESEAYSLNRRALESALGRTILGIPIAALNWGFYQNRLELQARTGSGGAPLVAARAAFAVSIGAEIFFLIDTAIRIAKTLRVLR